MKITLSALFFIGVFFGNGLFGQTFSQISVTADSIQNANGYAASAPFFDKKGEIALREFGDTSHQYVNSLLNICRNRTMQRKMSEMPALFASVEKALETRNLPLDPMKFGYFRAKGAFCFESQKFQEGSEWSEKGYEIAQKIWGTEAIQTLGARNNYAFSLISLLQYDRARPLVLQNMAQLDREKKFQHPYYLTSVFNLGTIYRFEGDYAHAIIYYQKAIELLKIQKRFSDIPNVAIHLLTIKSMNQTDFKSLERDIYEYLSICASVYPPNSYEYSDAIFKAGEMFMAGGFNKKAIFYLEKAANSAKNDSATLKTLLPFIQKDLGFIEIKNRNWEKAIDYNQKAYSNIPTKSGSSNHEKLQVLANLIEIKMELGQQSEADSLFGLFEKGVDSSIFSPESGRYFESFSFNYQLARKNFATAAAHLAKYKSLSEKSNSGGKGQLANYYQLEFHFFAQTKNLTQQDLALENWLHASEFLAEQDLFGYSEQLQIEYLNKIKRIHGFVLSNKFARPTDYTSAAEIFEHLTKFKSIVYQSNNLMHKLLAKNKDSANIQLIDQWRASKDKLSHLATFPKEKLASYGYDLEKVAAEKDQFERELIQKSTQFSEILQIPNQKWTSIREALPENSAAVDIYKFDFRLSAADEIGKFMYAVFILKPDSDQPKLVFLEHGNDLNSFVYEQYRADLWTNNKTSNQVYQAIWGKIEPYLSGVKTVFIAPDGIFHKINLSTLRLPSGQFLSEKHPFTTVQSLGELLVAPPKTTETAATACLFGNPRFDLKMPESVNSLAETATRSVILDGFLDESPVQLPPLPATEKEISEIANLLKTQNFRVQMWTDTAATEVNLRQVIHPKVLHIATHGHFLKSPKREKLLFSETETTENPMLRSMLFFAGANNTMASQTLPDSIGDGVLTALEAENLDLQRTELVVLSACDTGLGVLENGEGVFGLQRAFRSAGARFVLISLWEVEDAHTRIFMTHFYKNWLDQKQEIPVAFHETQLDMQKNGMSAQFWGAFVLVGK